MTCTCDPKQLFAYGCKCATGKSELARERGNESQPLAGKEVYLHRHDPSLSCSPECKIEITHAQITNAQRYDLTPILPSANEFLIHYLDGLLIRARDVAAIIK